MIGYRTEESKTKQKMNEDRAQLVERLKQANNVLITVSSNPTVDQLAACIGFTILLNKIGKHATAVFSGEVPSTLEFLKPEDTLEKNTDSLRDFIIALDKSKADKLRYKVEDTMVKIFITPYKTSISDADLEFSQGDFNVDAVLALGIHEREQVDKAIVGHGRILHDAVVMTADTKVGNNIGTINWVNEQASSLCEMLASVVEELQPQSLDAQISTALLTGIVSETERFRNQKTSSSTMEISSKLMAAGADQQLVASKLEPHELAIQNEQPQVPAEEVYAEEDDGAIIIDHSDEEQVSPELPPENPPIDEMPQDNPYDSDENKVSDNSEEVPTEADSEPAQQSSVNDRGQNSRLIIEPPTMGGTLTANSNPEPLEPSTDPLSAVYGDEDSMLTHSDTGGLGSPSSSVGTPTKLSDIMAQSSSLDNLKEATVDQTLEDPEDITVNGKSSSTEEELADIGTTVPQQNDEKTIADLEFAARNAIDDAIVEGSGSDYPEPIAGLNAQPLDLDLGHNSTDSNVLDDSNADVSSTDLSQSPTPGSQTYLTPPPTQDDLTDSNEAGAPPPVPPPMMPPFNSSSTASPQE